MISFPWDSIVERMEDGYPVYDRAYSAQQWWDIYKTFFTNGVFGNYEKGLQVIPGGGMTVKVQPGACNINGCFGHESVERSFTILPAASQPRIDCIVLRWDSNVEARSIDIFYKEGTPASSPKAPTLTRDETIWELGLANITVAANATSISASAITDTRADKARCGIVSPLMEVNTTGWYEQVQQFLKEKEAELNAQKNQGAAQLQNMYTELQKATDTALEATKNALDGSLAGSIQNQIDSLNDMTTGINLLRGTKDFKRGAYNVPYFANYYSDGWNDTVNSNTSKYIDTDGFTVINISQSTDAVKSVYSSMVSGVLPGETLTASFEFMIEDVNSFNFETAIFRYDVFNSNGGTAIAGTNFDVRLGTDKEILSGVWYKWTRSFTPASITSANNQILFSVRLNRAGSINFRKVKVEKGKINNPIWSPNPFDENDYTTGINLLRGTRDFTNGTIRTSQGAISYEDGFNNSNNLEIRKDSNGFGVLVSTATSSGSAQGMFTSVIHDVKKGDVLTISCEIMVEDASKLPVRSNLISVSDSSISTTPTISQINVTMDRSNEWVKIVDYVPFSSDYDLVRLNLRNPGVQTAIYFRKLCIYEGHINNPVWSASPFDVMPSAFANDDMLLDAQRALKVHEFNKHLGVITSDTKTYWSNMPSGWYFLNGMTGQNTWGLLYHSRFWDAEPKESNVNEKYNIKQLLFENGGIVQARVNSASETTGNMMSFYEFATGRDAARSRSTLGITRDWLVSTIGTFSGATTTKAGTVGLVPAPTGL